MLLAIRLAEYHPNRGEGREGVSFSDIQSHFYTSHTVTLTRTQRLSTNVYIRGRVGGPPPFLIYEGFEIRRHTRTSPPQTGPAVLHGQCMVPLWPALPVAP